MANLEDSPPAPSKDERWRNRALALAGLVQTIQLVEQLAKTGYLQTEPFNLAINSLFVLDPDSVEQVFSIEANNLQPNLQPLHQGLVGLETLLSQHRNPKNRDLLRYSLGILHLQKKLNRRSEMLYIIGNRLEKAKQQAAHFSPGHDNVVSNIADIYTDTISTFPYRIQIVGEYAYLQQSRVANQIRALLLASIRAATLWRQLGGSRWQLLLYRNKLTSITQGLIEQSKPLH